MRHTGRNVQRHRHRTNWRLATRKSGVIDFSWHALLDLRTVQELDGHKSIAMTMRYAHLAPSHLDATCEKTGAPTATKTATEQTSSQKEQQIFVQ
jgi:site-specific recombinase XerC